AITLYTTDPRPPCSLFFPYTTLFRSPDAGAFQIDWGIIVGGAVFRILVLAVLSMILVRKMRSLTLRQMISRDTAKGRKDRKICSLKRANLTGVLTKRFMFARKGTFLGILLSLSVGSVLF